MVNYICSYCRKEFSRAWNRDRHVKNIHRRHHDKDLNPRVLERFEFENIDPLSMEFRQNIRETETIHNSYRKEVMTHDIGVMDVKNVIGNYDYRNAIDYNFPSEHHIRLDDDEEYDDEKIELPRLLFKIRPKLIIFRRLFKNPNSPIAIMYTNYFRYKCISTRSSKPLDDILRRQRQRLLNYLSNFRRIR